ncbi:MAG: hypothetical protein RLZZ58_1141 [Pseudomonadota bacterium]
MLIRQGDIITMASIRIFILSLMLAGAGLATGAQAQADDGGAALAAATDWSSAADAVDMVAGAAYDKSSADDKPGAYHLYRQARDAAKAALARFGDTPEGAEALRDRLAENAMKAAEHLEPATAAEEADMVALLIDAADSYAITQTSFDENAQAFDWRNAADQLFDWGLTTADPRLNDWSAGRVRANRERVKRFDRLLNGLEFEESMLAMALIDHGWLTKDQAATDEGLALAKRLGDDAVFDLTDKIVRVADGRSPIMAPAALSTGLDLAQTDVAALEGEAFELALAEPIDHAKAYDAYLAIRDRAAPMIARAGIDAAYQARFLNSAANAAQFAADHLGATGDGVDLPGDPAVLRARAALLVEAQDWYARLRAVDPDGDVAGNVGTAWPGDSLFDIGMRLEPPEWADWSAKRVAAKRDEAARQDDIFSREQLAMALFDHGWLTKDAAAMAEAQAMMAAMGDDAGMFLKRKAARIAAGRAPYDVAD